jgi:hypothetical protein
MATSMIQTCRVTEEVDGKINGRKDRLRGHIGVSKIAEVDGCTIGPPAESEYAVEPVGVEMIIPSLFKQSGHNHLRASKSHTTPSVRCWPSTKISIVLRCALLPRWRATSFITCQSRCTRMSTDHRGETGYTYRCLLWRVPSLLHHGKNIQVACVQARYTAPQQHYLMLLRSHSRLTERNIVRYESVDGACPHTKGK